MAAFWRWLYITGKAYKGTSPNPQYVIRCLTEIFGPVGVGFGWSVVAEDFTPMGDEVLHWCRIQFWHTDRANAFDSYGQTKALMKTKNGMMLDEDAPKKSLTDAIVKAASHVGIAANIFLGRWDDQKYVAEVAAEYRAEERKTGGQDEASLRDALEEVLGEAMEAGEAQDAAIAQSETQARALWKIREATAELPAHMHPPINFDVSLPQADIGRFAEECRAALSTRWPGHTTVFFGHIGDGNLHLSTDASTVGGEEGAVEELVYAQVAAFGGSVSAEHGIGLHKKPYLHASRTPAELSAMRAIKQALDPLHLMNPGKVFDL